MLGAHVGVVAFVVLGQLAIIAGGLAGLDSVRDLRFRLSHGVIIVFIAVQTWLGQLCPLTNLEYYLRLRSGQQPYSESFTQHLLASIIFIDAPSWVFVVLHSVTAVVVIGSWWLVPPVWSRGQSSSFQELPFAHRGAAMGRAPVTIQANLTLARLRAMAGGFVFIVLLFIGGCAPLTVFNAVAPSDLADLTRSDLPYGGHVRQKLDVYSPASGAKDAPVVVVIYGGSWNSGNRTDYSFLGKALASRGFVTMVIDYRLVPEVRFPDFIDDCARAVVWAHTNAARFGGDPTRLFVLGHSAGAYNAAMVALDPRYLRAQGSDPAIIRGVIALAGPYDFLPLDVGSTVAAFGAAKDLAQTQPINFVSRGAPAMFLATGDTDTTVYPRNTLGLATKLKNAGNAVELHNYPDIGHVDILLALSVAFRSKAPVLDDISKFIRKL